jgi:NHLM bacteriocin system ABC transporter peptidase/ATP-binding protein
MAREGAFKPTRRIHRTPTVLQMEATECGAAALGSVLGYYGRAIPLAILRVDCGISRNGSNALNLLKAATHYGLTVEGLRREIPDLYNLRLPAILFWSFDHFVVLEGFSRHHAFINDPAVGRRKVPFTEFDGAFTGIVLTFAPGPDFSRSGSGPGIWRPLRERLDRCGGSITYAVLAGLLLVIPGLAIPAVTRVFVDDVLIRQVHNWLPVVLLVMVVTALIQMALTWLQRFHLLRLQIYLSVRGSSGFLKHLLRLSLSFFDQRYPGDLANRVQMNDTLAQLLSGQLAVTLISMVALIFYSLLMLRYNVTLALIVMVFGAINLIVLRIVSCRRIDLGHQTRQEQSLLMGISMSGLQMIESLKAGGLENDFLIRWTGSQTQLVADEQKLTLSTQLLTLLPSFLTLLATTAVLFFSGTEIIEGTMTVGTLVAFNALMICFMTPLNEIVGMGSMLQDAHACIERLDDVMKQPAVDRNWSAPGDTDSATPITGALTVEDVSFSFDPLGAPLIEDFSLELHPGQRIAIVGHTGSGKSTLALLCAGLLSPLKGQVLLDGKPLHTIPTALLARSIAMVNQDVFLFEGTIADNLTLWDDRIPETDIVQAAKDACIHDQIVLRTGAYQAGIREGGLNFSGGEQQRIEIARALAVNPPLLILDEATSALDPPTEKQIDDNLAGRGCSCIIVAHRLSTIRDCDEIIVMDGGKVAERGRHDELMARKGLYADLIGEQG